MITRNGGGRPRRFAMWDRWRRRSTSAVGTLVGVCRVPVGKGHVPDAVGVEVAFVEGEDWTARFIGEDTRKAPRRAVAERAIIADRPTLFGDWHGGVFARVGSGQGGSPDARARLDAGSAPLRMGRRCRIARNGPRQRNAGGFLQARSLRRRDRAWRQGAPRRGHFKIGSGPMKL